MLYRLLCKDCGNVEHTQVPSNFCRACHGTGAKVVDVCDLFAKNATFPSKPFNLGFRVKKKA